MSAASALALHNGLPLAAQARSLVWTPLVQAVSLSSLIETGGASLYVLFLFYTLSFIYALRRGCLLRGARWDTQRILVTAVGASCGVRALSFALCTLLALDVTTSPTSGWLSDSRLLLVLFNTGDWVAIVTYALLLLVWLEGLLRTRTTVYNPARIHRDWRAVMWALAAVLQLAQAGLYVAVFVAGPEDAPAARRFTDAIFETVAAFNVALPVLAAVGWALEWGLFAGFPFRSAAHQAAWARISTLLVVWTVGRVGWAVCSMLLTEPSAPASIQHVGPWLFPMLMVTVFVAFELIPFLMCLGSEILRAFSVSSRGPQARAAASGGGGSGRGSDGGGGGISEGGGGGGDEDEGEGDFSAAAEEGRARGIDAPLLGALNGIPEADEEE